ncbi:MAG: phytoene/squalene synthase family protein [Verrucomicrobiota bacterium]
MKTEPALRGSGRSNLAFALGFLPPQRRRDAVLFYRFCRTVDDIADNMETPLAERELGILKWRETIEQRGHAGLERLIARHGVDRSLVLEILEGCASDTRPGRFQTIAELETYCWRVACAVGLVSIRIFGCHDAASDFYAVHLGHALQLTNILRDVGEDARRGRIYLPMEDLERFGVPEREILEHRPGAGFQRLMAFEAGRARTRFAAAVPPTADFHALRPARVMARVYRTLLDKIERRRFPVFGHTVRLGRLEKTLAAAAALIESRGTKSARMSS